MKASIAFSNNNCAAYIAAIVRSFEQRHPETYLGRTALQKLTYFCTRLGVPIPCRFEIYTYGPYSDTVSFTAESLLADDVLVDKSKEQKRSEYHLGPQANDFLEEKEALIRPSIPRIDLVVDAFGGFRPDELELIATVHFLAQKQRAITNADPERDRVISEFIFIKGDKFPREQVIEWYDALKKAELI